MTMKMWIGALALSAVSVGAVVPLVANSASSGRAGMVRGHEAPSFEALDANGDGNITVAEFKARGDARFAESDTNGDGILSAEELVAGIVAKATERAEAGVARMIEWRDSDGDGALSMAELAGTNGERIFGHMDENGDGVISAEEYEKAKERRGDRKGNRQGKSDRRGG